MKNKFNRCCCGEVPPLVVPKCRICEVDCTSTHIGSNVFIYNQRHPDEGKEGFVAQGRLTGSFLFSSVNGQLRLIFNHNQNNGTYDTLDIFFGEGTGFFRPVRFVLRRENAIIASNTQNLIGASSLSMMAFCFEFDADGDITIVLYSNETIHAQWSTTLAPGTGGGVGYRLTDVGFIGSLPFYHRASTEIIDEVPCPGCMGAVCVPCCPNGAAINWLLDIPSAFVGVPHDFFPFNVFTGCELIGGMSYVMQPFGPCRWSYVNRDINGQVFDYDNVNIQFPCDPVRLGKPTVGTFAWLMIVMTVEHIGTSRCKMVVSVLLAYSDEFGGDLFSCEIARWEKMGELEGLCHGNHTLDLVFSEPLLCVEYPGSVTVQAL